MRLSWLRTVGRQWLGHRWQDATERLLPRRRIRIADGHVLPRVLPYRDLIVTRDDGEDWSVGMRCPCGCGEIIELMLVPEAKPRWTLTHDALGRGSLSPSVWRKTGCRSHFWLREGRVHWCR